MPELDWLITELTVTGGAETYAARLVPLLQARGWDIRMITLASGGQLADSIQRAGIPLVSLGAAHPFDLRVLPRLLRLWRRDPPRILHTHLYHAGLLGRIAARPSRLPQVIVHQHGLEQTRSSLRSLLDRLTSPLVDHYAVTCNAVGRILQQREHISSSKIRLVYSGLDLAAFANPPQEKPANWPVPAGIPVIGSVGRLSPEKDHASLIRALAQLQNLDPPPHLILVGDGPELVPLENLAAQHSLGARVHFVGRQDSVIPWLANFTVFALPSIWEGLPLALLESLASGCPSIATSVGGIPEVIRHNQNGLLIPPSDTFALAAALRRLLLDPVDCKQIAANGRRTILENFTISDTLTQLETLYLAKT